MATFICDVCDYRKSVVDSHIGRHATCPKCQTRGLVQAANGIAPPEPVPPEPPRIATSDTKDCPFCAETIAKRAIKCKHCGSMLDGHSAIVDSPESILADIAANVFRGMDAVTGRLQITTMRLVFTPQGNIFQASGLVIPLHDITSLERRNTWGVFANGMLVRTQAGVEYHFVVWNRDTVIAEIKKAAALRNQTRRPG